MRRRARKGIVKLPLTGVLTLIAMACLAVGPFETDLRAPHVSSLAMSLGPSSPAQINTEADYTEQGEIDQSKVASPSKTTPPPGLNDAFISQLANESPAVSFEELREILHLTWQICQEERYHFVRAVAQMRAESDFNPSLISSAGARGLMQVIPRTGDFMGFKEIDSIEANIRCGIRYMKWLERFTEHAGARERWIATLASYNSGPGRYVEMVRRTKLRYKKNDWSHVQKTYRRRFRRAPGRKLPETLIYVNRNLQTLGRLHDNLFTVCDVAFDDLTTAVRIPPSSKSTMTD